MDQKTPGVYIKEISSLPASIVAVETAIPAFIGYTEKAISPDGEDLTGKAVRIRSMVDYDLLFGGAYNEKFTITTTNSNGIAQISTVTMQSTPNYRMFHSLRLYFDNGGGPCYIISVDCYTVTPGNLSPSIDPDLLKRALDCLSREDEPTLILFPDAVAVTTESDFYGIYTKALDQCDTLKDRFTIVDVYDGDTDFTIAGAPDVISGFRSGIGSNYLLYGAAYYPWLKTIYEYNYREKDVVVGSSTLENLKDTNNKLYNEIKKEIAKLRIILPPGPAVAGVYATVDRTRGVWKAPANVSLNAVEAPVVLLDDDDQENLNVDTSGKSVNAIRYFTGKGILVWGARTLVGNDNEWRYVPVRRFFNMVEESVKKATEAYVFEPNDANTWTKVKGMIKNFLTLQWRVGALAGAKAEDAFFVNVGLGSTMNALDILEGRMIVEIGMAVVRPAEFIILRFSHKMQES